jgi:hypothetical protein
LYLFESKYLLLTVGFHGSTGRKLLWGVLGVLVCLQETGKNKKMD